MGLCDHGLGGPRLSDYLITFHGGLLQITPAVLTVTADDKSRVYGNPNPVLTARYSGFVNGDTSSVLAAPRP